MGREIKRVPLDFDWPIGEVWQGFLNPHYRECDQCGGRGATASLQALERIIRLLMIAGEDSRMRPSDFTATGRCIQVGNRLFPHPYLIEAGIADPGSALHELTAALAGREPSFMGHDSSDVWRSKNKILAAVGLPEDWGDCPQCKGDGTHPDAKAAYEAWEETEPPAGSAWQLWSTTSEGHPMSPPCETAEQLADWLVKHEATTFADQTASYGDWLAFILGPGWAPSMVGTSAGLVSGVNAMIEQDRRN